MSSSLPASFPSPMDVKIGVLALQGAFIEHINMVRSLGATAVEVKKPEHLEGLDGLILPGGESTTMGLIASRTGLIEPLRAWVRSNRPTWGTCAGMILMAERVEGQKEQGQPLLGGMDIGVCRNFFGAQVQSFETDLDVPELKHFFDSAAASSSLSSSTSVSSSSSTSPASDVSPSDSSVSASASSAPLPPAHVSASASSAAFHAVFIRAPAALSLGPLATPLASVLCSVKTPSSSSPTSTPAPSAASEPQRVYVAVRQGNLLATAFHPELTEDSRWHQFFLHLARASRT